MHDLLITGGTVVDGTGSPARLADLAIQGDRIIAIGIGQYARITTLWPRQLLARRSYAGLHQRPQHRKNQQYKAQSGQGYFCNFPYPVLLQQRRFRHRLQLRDRHKRRTDHIDTVTPGLIKAHRLTDQRVHLGQLLL